MIYLEMTRHESHGGGSWSLFDCVWAPTRKKNGWRSAFWDKILQIRKGDLIVHLQGVRPKAEFIGYSIASGTGFETRDRPPDPGDWDYARRYYRANLTDTVQFQQALNLDDVFTERKTELVGYLERNKAREAGKANIFYTKRSSGRLECVNGAHVSDIDDDLLAILFPNEATIPTSDGSVRTVSVETGTQIASVHARRGQERFSREVKDLYCNRCCFPGCSVADDRFLVGSHIARWSDNESLRGNPRNGLCFCVLHDKAFEVGLFTLDDQFQVFVNPRERSAESEFLQELFSHHGKRIRLAKTRPLKSALSEHRHRVNIDC